MRHDFKSVRMPERIAFLPQTPEGYPVPFVNMVRPDGMADLKTLDMNKVAQAIDERLCGICGGHMDYYVVFIGGEACEANRFFADPPMHAECADYAAKVCPFLAIQGYKHAHTLVPNPLAPPAGSKRPDKMMKYICHEYRRVTVRGTDLIRAGEPIRVEWF